MQPSQLSLRPGSAVNLEYFHPSDRPRPESALILSLSMDPSKRGLLGEPALELVFVDVANMRHIGTADFTRYIDRRIEVVHHSHVDFEEGRVAMAYSEVPSLHWPTSAEIPSDESDSADELASEPASEPAPVTVAAVADLAPTAPDTKRAKHRPARL